MFSEVEYTYRESYVEGVASCAERLRTIAISTAVAGCPSSMETLPQTGADDCHVPPRADKTPAPAGGGGWPDHTPKRTRCRGYSQGVEAALLAVKPALSSSTCALKCRHGAIGFCSGEAKIVHACAVGFHLRPPRS